MTYMYRSLCRLFTHAAACPNTDTIATGKRRGSVLKRVCFKISHRQRELYSYRGLDVYIGTDPGDQYVMFYILHSSNVLWTKKHTYAFLFWTIDSDNLMRISTCVTDFADNAILATTRRALMKKRYAESP